MKKDHQHVPSEVVNITPSAHRDQDVIFLKQKEIDAKSYNTSALHTSNRRCCFYKDLYICKICQQLFNSAIGNSINLKDGG